MAQVELIVFANELFDEREVQNGISVTRLLGGYAIVTLPEESVEEFLTAPGILYAELPARVYTTVEFGRASSCITNRPSAGRTPDNLNGTGVLVGIIDSGIDYRHPDFCKEDGTTRIAALWDQSIDVGNPPAGYGIGTLFSAERINEALAEEVREVRDNLVPSTDVSGHGTHVSGIAAGNGRASEGKYRGVAYESELLVVKLAETRSGRAAVSGTARLMEAVDFCVRFAMEKNQPLALNLSYGTREGAHNGRSLLETYLDAVSVMAKCVICVGTGNDAALRAHAGGKLSEEPVDVELAVEGRERSLELELWSNYPDKFTLELVAPSGERTQFLQDEGERITAFGSAFLYSAVGKTVRLGNVEAEGFWSAPTIYQNLSEFRLCLTAEEGLIGAGVWIIRLIPERIVEGTYDIWLLRGEESTDTGFTKPDAFRTLTIPSTSESVISVGAYDFGNLETAPFSGRGTARETGRMKPDLVAPGVDVISCAARGGYTAKTGTSMATPFVTGSSALLLQWGIIEGNDPYLYGEKLREYLLSGATRLPGDEYPNPLSGWGRLCLFFNDGLL